MKNCLRKHERIEKDPSGNDIRNIRKGETMLQMITFWTIENAYLNSVRNGQDIVGSWSNDKWPV